MLGNSTLRVHFGVVKTENPQDSSGKPRRKGRPSIKSDLYISSAGESTSAGETSGGDYTQTDDSETELGTHVVGRGRRDLRNTATSQAVYQRPLRKPPQEPSLWLSTPPESGTVRGVCASFGGECSSEYSQNRSQNRSQSRSRSQSPHGVERSGTSREQDALVRHMARMGSGASIRQQRIEAAAEKAAGLDRQRKAAVDAEVTALVLERRRRRAETAAALNRSRTDDGVGAPQDGFSFRNSSAQLNSWVPRRTVPTLQPPWLTNTPEPLPKQDLEIDPPSILQEPLLEMEAVSPPAVASPRYVVLLPPPMISPNRLSPVVGHTSIPQRPSPPSLPTVADAATVYLHSGHSKRRRRNTGVPFEQQSWPRLPDSGSDRE